MENCKKYERQYFMPPKFEYDWVKKDYVDALKDYHGNLLLAGINYDKKTKKHSCTIEKMEKV